VSNDIVPDTKNWTWVLEERCADCGFEASRFDVAQTGPAIRDIGQRWQGVLGRPDAVTRPRPDVWSPLEYGCHVRDVLRIFDVRLGLMIAENGPHFANWDQDATAVEDRYDLQEPAIVAGELLAAANALADHFDAISGDQWSRRGFRSDGTEFTVDSLARYLMHDPVHHLWDVQAAEAP
jgi:ribosomal protein S15P/S13E